MTGEMDPNDPDMKRRQAIARLFIAGMVLALAAAWFYGKAVS